MTAVTTALEHLTMLAVSPPELVSVAALAGFDAVGVRISPASDDERPWPMAPGSPMLRETLRRSRDLGIRILDVEALRLGVNTAVRGFAPVLEAAATLEARYVGVLADDPDLDRFRDRFAEVADLAVPLGLRPVVEFMAYRPVRTLSAAVAVARAAAGGGILVDALHVQRCATSLAELAAVDGGLFTYLQLCDGPRNGSAAPDVTAAVAEARTARLLPGAGEFALDELLEAVPPGLPLAVEAPNAALAQAQPPEQIARLARISVQPYVERYARRSPPAAATVPSRPDHEPEGFRP